MTAGAAISYGNGYGGGLGVFIPASFSVPVTPSAAIPNRALAGLGDISPQIQQAITAAPAIIGGVAATTVAAGTAWIPFIGPIVAGVTLGLSALFARKGPRQKVATTQIVDSVEPLLRENRDGYLAGPRTRMSQAQATENFRAGWEYIVQSCDIPEMGEPGQRCVRERERGGSAPWCPTTTGCDWFALYLDPIANDPDVKPDPTIAERVGGTLDNILAPISNILPSGGLGGLLLPAGLVAFALIGLGGDGDSSPRRGRRSRN